MAGTYSALGYPDSEFVPNSCFPDCALPVKRIIKIYKNNIHNCIVINSDKSPFLQNSPDLNSSC